MAETFKDLFSKTSVLGVTDDKPARLVIEGLTTEELWINSVKGGVEPNYQLMYSVGDGAFLNAFNQRFSLFMLDGIYIPSQCGTVSSDKEPEFLKFYKKHNIVTSSAASEEDIGDPIGITFNNITITGWVVKLAIGSYSKEGIDGHTFSLSFLGKIDGIDQYFTADKPSEGAVENIGDTMDTAKSDSVLNAAEATFSKTDVSDVKTGSLANLSNASVDNAYLDQQIASAQKTINRTIETPTIQLPAAPPATEVDIPEPSFS
jgi:hypothetical protein